MRALASVLAAVLGFLAVNRAVAALVPWPKEVGLRAKLEHLERHADDYDVVVLGGSATYYGVVPRIVEEELAARGHELSVFNLGVGGMGSYESEYVLRRLLALEPARLKLLLYEEPVFDPLLWYPDIFNPRYIHWHDLAATRAAIRGLAFALAPPDYKRAHYDETYRGHWKLGLAWEHVLLFLRKESTVGTGVAVTRALLGRDAHEVLPPPDAVAAGAGWIDISTESSPGVRRAHENFTADPAAWDRAVDGVREGNRLRPDPEESFDLAGLAGIVARIRAANARPVFYVAPRGLPNGMVFALAEGGHLPDLLAFHDPDVYPELFAAENHWDPSHLTGAGAALWSRMLGRRLADLIEEGGLPGDGADGDGD